MQSHSELSTTALKYLDAGFNAIPLKTNGSKDPDVFTWKPYMSQRQTPSQINTIFHMEEAGIGLLTGRISDHFEVIDIDSEETFGPYIHLLEEEGGKDLFSKLCIIKTPRPGYHIWYRCLSGIQPSQHLAKSESGKILIETRGEGGYIVAPGSHINVHENKIPYEVVQGDPLNIPNLSAVERNLLFSCARQFNEEKKTPFFRKQVGQKRPNKYKDLIDEFDQSLSWQEILEPHGFLLEKISEGEEYYQKPNSSNPGIHITTNFEGFNKLKCFSSSCPYFEQNKNYTKFEAHCILNYDGNESAAISDLLKIGIGWKEEKPLMREMPNSQPFPLEALGEIMGNAAAEMEKVIKAPVGVCGQSILAGACIVVLPKIWTIQKVKQPLLIHSV